MSNDKFYMIPNKDGSALISDEAIKYLKERIGDVMSKGNKFVPFLIEHCKVECGRFCFTVEDLDNFILTL